jgi:hypothetical protein
MAVSREWGKIIGRISLNINHLSSKSYAVIVRLDFWISIFRQAINKPSD